MNDPHVEYLTYRIEGDDDYSTASPIDSYLPGFRIKGPADSLRVIPESHFSSVEGCKEAAEPHIRNWEASVNLRLGPGAFRLVYMGGHAIDRKPNATDGQSPVVGLGATMVAIATCEAKATISRGCIPEPPGDMNFSADAGDMLARYQKAVQGKRGWMETAYWIYTMAVYRFPKHNVAVASEALGLSKSMLDQLRRISSTRGGRDEGRKAGSQNPLTREDLAWVKEACHDVIAAVARYDAKMGDVD